MKLRIKTYNLKAAEKCKLFIATDIHYESGHPLELLPIINEARRIHPDAIIIAGDTINYLDDISSIPDQSELFNFFQMLSKIAPVYVGVGNHDQMHDDRKFIPEAMKIEQEMYLDFIKSLPKVTLVHNQRVKIKQGINLIGLTLPRDAYQIPGTTGTQEPASKLKELLKSQHKLLDRTNPNETNILLIHSPRRFTPEIISQLDGIDYIVCGHMHQGCVPFGLDEILPGTGGIIAPGYAPFPIRARHTYPNYSDKLIVLPAYKTFAGWRRIFNALYPQSMSVLQLS